VEIFIILIVLLMLVWGAWGLFKFILSNFSAILWTSLFFVVLFAVFLTSTVQ